MLKIDTKPFTVLTTQRLVLRRLAPSDVDELTALRSNEQVNRYLNRPPTTTTAQAEAFIKKIDDMVESGKGFYWVIALKNDPKLIGTICYWNLQDDKNSVETGYELMPEFQGRGLMSEALTEVIRFGTEDLERKLIIACVHPDNQASIKLLKKNGFVWDEKNEAVSVEDVDGLAGYVLVS